MSPQARLGLYAAMWALFAAFAVLVGGPAAFMLIPSPHFFPWAYFLVLAALEIVALVATLLDDHDEHSWKRAVSSAEGAAFLGGFYFGLTVVLRWLAGVIPWHTTVGSSPADRNIRRLDISYGLDDPDILGPWLAIWFYLSWLMWMYCAGLSVAKMVRYHEGLIRIGFPVVNFFHRRRLSQRRRRCRRMAYPGMRPGFQEQRDIEDRYRQVQREEANLRAEFDRQGEPGLEAFFRELQELETIPRSAAEYQFPFGEAYRRWVERQQQKSIRVTRERIQELGHLYAAWLKLQQLKAEIVKAYAALKQVYRDVENADLERELKHAKLTNELARERAQTDVTAEVARMRLEIEKTQLEVDLKRLKLEREALEAQQGFVRAGEHAPLVLGRSDGPSRTGAAVRLDPRLRVRHLYIIGQTQTGKTTLIQNLVRQDIEQGQGCAFVDPHGDAVPQLLGHVPERRIEDIVYLDFTERAPVVAFNPLDAPYDQRQGVVEDFISYFARFFETDVTAAPRMTHILRYSLLALLASREPKTVADLERLLVDAEYRNQLLAEVSDSTIRDFWAKQFPDVKRQEAQPILTRLSALLAPGSQLRRILTQPENRIDFADIMNGRKVLLVRLSKGRGLEAATHFLGALIITRIQQEAMARAEMPPSQRQAFALYVDEFQNYTVSSFETILAESAKYRLSLVMANQTMHSLPASLRTAILGNIGTMAAFRIGSEDAQVMQREIRVSAADLMNLHPHQAFIRLGRPDAVERIKTERLPVPSPQADEIRHQVIDLSRRRYYRHPVDGQGPGGGGKVGGNRPPEDFLE